MELRSLTLCSADNAEKAENAPLNA
jgi:hypothetical protein